MYLEGNSNAHESRSKDKDDNWGRERLDFLHFPCSLNQKEGASLL